jgi:ArsR family transcriptional regulator
MLSEIREHGELNCSQICERFALSQPTISHHIKTLAEAGILRMRKEGQYHVLSVDESMLSQFAAHIAPVLSARPESAQAS